MSCEADLSGTDLKIIQYSIVTVDPYLKDCDYDDDEPCEDEEEGRGHHPYQSPRVLFGPSTISTTQDMTEADFTAWVIALNFGNPTARKVGRCEKQYLRVCYSVQCRLPMPDANYKKRQVEILEEISRCLCRDRDEGHRGGLPAKER